MMKRALQKKKSICTVLSIFAVMVMCMVFSDQAYADGVIQGHPEIVNEAYFHTDEKITRADLYDYIPIQYSVDYNYTEAYKLVDMVNQLRTSQGKTPLIATDYLMRIAMDRAAQTKVFPEHAAIIPNFPYSPTDTTLVYPYYTDTTEIHSPGSPVELGGNYTVCGNTDSDTGAYVGEAVKAYENFGGNDHQGAHYENMIADRYKYIGVGIVNHECIIVFYPNNLEKSPTFDPNAGYGNLVNGSGAYTGYTPRKIAKSRVDSAYFLLNNTSEDIMMYRNSLHVKNPLKIGDSLTLSFAGVKDWLLPQFIVTSSNPSVLEVNGQTVTAKKSGTATLSVYMSASPDICVSAPVSVQANEEKNNKKNTKVTVDLIYSKAVIDKDSKTAEFAGMNKKYAKNLAGYIMPNTISYNGKSYRVTSIGNNAFKNCKNLKKITIPKDIERIGNNAFRGCSKLQTITVQSTKLTKVGKNAFKGIKKNAKIKVPKKKLAAYKKLMKGKGQKVKVVKK